MDVLLINCFPTELCPQLPSTQPFFSPVFLIWKAGSLSLAAVTTTQNECQGFLQTLILGHSISYGDPFSPDLFMMFQGKEVT